MIYTIYQDQISLFFNDSPFNIPKDDTRFEKIKELLLANNFAAVQKLIEYENYFSPEEELTFKDNVLFYKEEKLPVVLSDLVLQAKIKDLPYEHYIKFFIALKYNKDFCNNPNKRKIFYRKFKDAFILDDVVIYDAEENLPIDNFYDFRDLPRYFQAIITTKSNVKEAIHELAGFKSDKLIKLFKQEVFKEEVDVTFIAWLALLKDLVDPNFLYENWESNKVKVNLPHPQFLNNFLKNYKASQQGIVNFINNSEATALRRLCVMVFESRDLKISLPDCNSAQDLVPILAREIGREKGSLFFLHLEDHFPLLKTLQLNMGGLEIVIPQHNEELNEWSRIMNNCIATYAQRAKKGECLLLGIQKNNKLIYNLEITTAGKVKQFLAKANSRAYQAEQKVIEEFLSKNHILK